jgi:hypothetical protein
MSVNDRLTIRQARIIAEHNQRLVQGAEIALAKVRSTPINLRDDMDRGMILYWRHAIKALNWSTQTALQRVPRGTNATTTPECGST